MPALHAIRIDATRRVSIGGLGGYAYRLSSKRIEIPFGKGHEFKTGKQALAYAHKLAEPLLGESSSLSIWRMHGGSGMGTYLKDDHESRFKTPWDDDTNF